MNSIKYDALRKAASDLATQASAINEELSKLKSYYDQIGEGSQIWSGTAANSVRAEFDSVSKHFQSFVELVTTSSSNITQVANNYEAWESSQASQA